MNAIGMDRLCRQIVEESGDGLLYADTEGIIRLWNRGATMIFGFTAEEAVGNSLDLIVPEKLRPRHWQGYNQVMATGVSRYAHDLLAVPALHKEGKALSVEFTVVMVRDEDDMLVGIAAIVRDVTARWAREKEMKERLARLEKPESI